ncbi:MAG: hypothetical protein QM817_40215 [Archangium sp.]
MSLALAALVVVLGQSGKVEVIKGKKSAPAAASKQKVILAPEFEQQAITDKSQPKDDARAADLDKKAAQLDAKEKALDEKSAAIDAKQKQDDDAEKAKAEKLKAQQKQIEKIGEQNKKLWQQSADALAGGE